MEENSMFDMFKSEFSSVGFDPILLNNSKDTELLRMLRDSREKNLSPFAFKTSDSLGRLSEEEPCYIRTAFERDMGRIIFAESFRRLRHKTQVFFNPSNDHICSRIEHVIYVNYIATIIAKALNLNVDLVQAIAMGHDVGHAPFGHSGERVLDKCLSDVDPDLYFEHEQQSLRVLDILEERANGQSGLNLSFEVRDGIVSHCGETYDERSLAPVRDKKNEDIVNKGRGNRTAPATLEGCVVRFADKIAYVGRDMEDALRAGYISSNYLSSTLKRQLGDTNSQVINTLVSDIIHSSMDRDEIRMSDSAFEAMNEFLTKNVNQIYRSSRIKTYEKTVTITIEALFDAFMKAADDVEEALASSSEEIRHFGEYLVKHPEQDAHSAIKVADYISGMTDGFATKTFDSLFRI